MGLGGISMWQLLIILAIVILIFGTKRLTSLGGDVGGAIKSFRKAMDSDDSKKPEADDAKQLGEQKQPDAEFSESKDEQRQQG